MATLFGLKRSKKYTKLYKYLQMHPIEICGIYTKEEKMRKLFIILALAASFIRLPSTYPRTLSPSPIAAMRTPARQGSFVT